MRAPTFEDYLREYSAQGIGELWYGLICEMVEQTVKKYPPEVYSPNRVWDEDAVSSVCHDYIMERILGSRRLEYFLASQETVTGLSRNFAHDFRQFITSRKRRSEYLNLYERLQKGLAEDSRFSKHSMSHAHQSFWGLSGWSEKAIVQDRTQVLGAMFAAPLPPIVRYRPDSKKISPILGNQDLLQFVADCLRQLDAFIGFHLLMECLRYRLDLLDDDVAFLDEPIPNRDQEPTMTRGDIVAGPDDYQRLTQKDVIENLYERLSDRQRDILALHSILEHPTLEEIACQIGVSKSTVGNELMAIRVIIQSQPLNEDVDQVFDGLLNRCADSYDDNKST